MFRKVVFTGLEGKLLFEVLRGLFIVCLQKRVRFAEVHGSNHGVSKLFAKDMEINY